MGMMLQLRALGRPASRAVGGAVRTARRRPWLVAVATGLAMLRVLPGGEPVQPVEIVDLSGAVEQVFSLAADDPKLESLRRAAEEASHPDYRKRSPDYYRAQWDAVTAEFYLANDRRLAGADAAVVAGRDVASNASHAVSPVSYQQDSAESVAAHTAAVHGGRDWTAFWGEQRASAILRMRRLEPPPRVDPKFARMRFGEVGAGPYPTPTVFAAICIAVLAFLATARWACRPPRRLIGLRAEQQLEVPAEWIRQRRSWRELRTAWTGGRIVEAVAAAVLLLLLVG